MDSVIAVEKLLKYNFKNKSLLKDALTHRTCKESTSNERLEFFGDSAIGLAVTKHLYFMYPKIEPNELSPLRRANITNEKFARDALKHRLYQFLRHKSTQLDEMVKNYTEAMSKEDESDRIGKVTKALPDLVEAIAGAVFIDVEFDLQRFWMICKVLLEPLVTLEEMGPQPPVFRLKQFCKNHGKALSISHRIDDTNIIGEVYFDDELFAFAYGEDKSTAKRLAAEEAARKLPEMVIDENTPKVEPKDAKGELQTGSSSLLTASEMTPKKMVIDENTPEVAEGELQTGSSSLLTASEMTPKQMVIDSPQVESEDAKGELTKKLHIRNPLIYEMTNEEMVIDDEDSKPENAKQKLNEICAANRWPYPIYSLEEEKGLEERYVCTVKIEIPSAKGSFYMKGDNKTRKKYAENSSACHMIRDLKSSLMYPHVGDLGPKLSFAETRRLLMQEILKDENTPEVEPEDAKGKLQTGSSSLLTASEMTPKQMVIDENTPEVEPEDAEGELQTGSSSLLTASEMTPKQMVVDEITPEVEPEDAEGELQTRSSSFLTASEMTPKQMVIDSPQIESEDAKGELTKKLHIRNPLIYEMTNEEMVIDEDKPENAKQKLNEICAANRWPYPIYSLEEEKGLEERYVCTVKIEIPSAKGSFYMKGDNKTRKKYAEYSSACHMIRALKSSLMYPHVGDLGPKLSFAETRRLLMQEIFKDEKRLQSLGGLRRSKRRKI